MNQRDRQRETLPRGQTPAGQGACNLSAPATCDSPSWRATAGVAILGLLVCSLAITSRSYWLDEASIYKATMPTLGTWWTSMREGDCHVQQPLYYLFAWAWEKLAGTNEFAMRAGNAPWFVLGLVVMYRALAAAPLLRRSLVLVLLCSPFAWYYLNEARPYALFIGASLLVLAALYRLALGGMDPGRERCWSIALCLSSVVLAASGLLAMLWLGAYLGAASLSTPRERWAHLVRRYGLLFGLTSICLFVEGLFYLWTLSIGARATAVGSTDFRNLPYVVYELFGFSGLGPGRLGIRANPSLSVFRPWLPWLTLYGLLLLAVLAPGWRWLRQSVNPRTRACWAAAFLLVAGFILTVGVTRHFRVLGRHFAPALPLVVFLMASGITAWLQRRDWLGKAVAGAFIGLSLVSCGELRFSGRNLKDDYRGAAALAREALARGETVWWNADDEGALIYGVALANSPGTPQSARYLMNPPGDFDHNLPRPDLVLTSKPDVYDANGALKDYLVRAGFQPTATLTAFTAWRATKK